ncbi:siderophore ABC transporter substrate-binding protein [Marinibacterium profundimaris]|uniref:Iron ABC transporter substrate-binding protein n=1 Tax=Marinibacterium profundimaris TaxID=1679460 RepID=A0A225NSE4_9RHOB|nr:siderophore ABC transporter substrate-binding protein [Marinibacterium profundimaris]OWU77763.1 iron ABC transporter substrate-binding protein [Marinibacterium profundimaris]
MFRQLTLACALMAAPALADPVTIDTYAGPVEVDRRPDSIAVFDLAALDTLDALGVTADGAVAPLYLDYLAEAGAGAVTVGSLFEPDYEALAGMAPDLIIAGGRSQEAVPQLARLAPTLDMTIWEDPVGQGLDRLDAYGTLFGKEAEAAELRAGLTARLEAARAAAEGQGRALIVMTNGPKVAAYGAEGRFGWLHTALGLEEAIAGVEQSSHGEAISFEFIKEANPDVLIVIDRLAAIGQDGASAQATLDNALVRDTAAWQNDRVIYIDSGALYIAGGGVQSMNRILDQVIAAFDVTGG